MPGLGTAEYLVERGKRVDIVVPTFYVGEQLEPGNIMLTYQRILGRGVKLIPNSEVKRIKGESVTVMNVYTQEEEDISGDVINQGVYFVKVESHSG